MKMSLLFLLFALAAVLHAAPVYVETFEEREKNSISDIRIEADNPASGKFCGHLDYAPGAKSPVRQAQGHKVIPVEPGQWYRMSVKTRNDIKIGEVKFGLIESRSAEKRVSQYYDWHWKAVSLNINEWRSYAMEFKTAANTKGVMLYLRTENGFSGSSWWDDIKLEKFDKKFPPFEIKPFRAAATFTDIPSKAAIAVTK